MTNILIGVMIVLFVSEILFMVAFFKLYDKIDYLKSDIDFYKNLCQINEKYYKLADEHYGAMCEKVDSMNNMYFKILKATEMLCNEYKEIRSQHEQLLDAWRMIEDRYAQSYEEFAQCSKELQSLNEKLSGTTEDEMMFDVTAQELQTLY